MAGGGGMGILGGSQRRQRHPRESTGAGRDAASGKRNGSEALPGQKPRTAPAERPANLPSLLDPGAIAWFREHGLSKPRQATGPPCRRFTKAILPAAMEFPPSGNFEYSEKDLELRGLGGEVSRGSGTDTTLTAGLVCSAFQGWRWRAVAMQGHLRWSSCGGSGAGHMSLCRGYDSAVCLETQEATGSSWHCLEVDGSPEKSSVCEPSSVEYPYSAMLRSGSH